MLGAIAALAVTTPVGVAAAAGDLKTQAAPLSPADIEGPEFTDLARRFGTLFGDTIDATRAEEAAKQRFAAEAPLRPSKPIRKYPSVQYDIVRDHMGFETMMEDLKLATARREKSGEISLRIRRSVVETYHDLADNPVWTKDGEAHRRILGASSRWETALVESAEATGYASARRRRRTLEIELRDVIVAILKHKPKTLSAIKVQAISCMCSPCAQWVKDPQAAAFLNSIADFDEEQLNAPAVVAA
jgi:hypothetical protein